MLDDKYKKNGIDNASIDINVTGGDLILIGFLNTEDEIIIIANYIPSKKKFTFNKSEFDRSIEEYNPNY